MKVVYRRILSAACVLAGLSFGAAAQADIYTYALQAPAGSNGSISGTITVNGAAGAPFPALNAVSSLSFTYTPTSGSAFTLTQADTIDENYNEVADFGGGGILGAATIFALTPVSGANFWSVTDPSGNEIDLNFTPSPYGPNWTVENPGPFDSAFGGFSLVLQSDVTPEPSQALLAMLPAGLLLLRRRSAAAQ